MKTVEIVSYTIIALFLAASAQVYLDQGQIVEGY